MAAAALSKSKGYSSVSAGEGVLRVHQRLSTTVTVDPESIP